MMRDSRPADVDFPGQEAYCLRMFSNYGWLSTYDHRGWNQGAVQLSGKLYNLSGCNIHTSWNDNKHCRSRIVHVPYPHKGDNQRREDEAEKYR